MSLNQIIGENIGFVIIIILLLLIGAILLGILALTKKSKSSSPSPQPQPLNSKEFKNNYCRSINNPSYAGANWIPGKCVSGTCNNALCDPGDKNCKYMDLCNAYGSENGQQSDEIGSCCGLAANARMLEKNQDFQNYYCRSHNQFAQDDNPMKQGEYANWVQKTQDCDAIPGYVSKNPGYMNDGTCCIPKNGVAPPTPK
jgi:hypothetical protein